MLQIISDGGTGTYAFFRMHIILFTLHTFYIYIYIYIFIFAQIKIFEVHERSLMDLQYYLSCSEISIK